MNLDDQQPVRRVSAGVRINQVELARTQEKPLSRVFPYLSRVFCQELSGGLGNGRGALTRPLKAVARVRIPSGLPGKPPLTRPGTTTSQPVSSRIDRQGRARDARTPTGAAFNTLQISRLRLPNMGSSAGDLCSRE